jgi:FtsP/CotA-like multicopper oxidase with cupredoxin domain
LELGHITVNNVSYPRRVLRGSGPQWGVSDGVSGLFIGDGVTNTTYDLSVRYINLQEEGDLIHHHGQTPNYTLDGVPYIDSPLIEVNSSKDVTFSLTPGTYLAHSHFSFHHDQGVAVPMIVNAPLPTSYPNASVINGARQVLLWLEDFCPYSSNMSSAQNPTCYDILTSYNQLKSVSLSSSPMAMSCPSNSTDMTGMAGMGMTTSSPTTMSMSGAMADSTNNNAENAMSMGISYMTHLANGLTMANPHIVYVQPGETIRLRSINAASMVDYNVTLGNLTGTIIAADGQLVQPHQASSYWLGVAQRIDIVITMPTQGGLYPILALEEGQTPMGQAGILLVSSNTTTFSQLYNETSMMAAGMGTVASPALEMSLSAWQPLTARAADRDFALVLTGVNGFNSINNLSYQLPPMVETYTPNPNPLRVMVGERVCIRIVNTDSMTHPMHLHGHHFQVMEVNGMPINGSLRDTVVIPDSCGSMKICFDANNPGVHPLHCHMTYHMMAGMLTTIEYMSTSPACTGMSCDTKNMNTSIPSPSQPAFSPVATVANTAFRSLSSIRVSMMITMSLIVVSFL